LPSEAKPQPAAESSHIRGLTLHGCEITCAAAKGVRDGLTDGSPQFLEGVRQWEEDLDNLDREINEAVTTAITRCSEADAAELLACLKVVNELERIGDLLLGFANRASTLHGRLATHDVSDLETMTGLLCKMLADATEAFRTRDTKLALAVLRADTEMDRLRNLLFVRHIENPENKPQQESFHVIFMTQALERSGDHAKNLAEEVVHLVSGRSVRHLLRAQDKPDEVRFVDFMRRNKGRSA
jgi:phosphate transport system protein